jgi:hypothetical protein
MTSPANCFQWIFPFSRTFDYDATNPGHFSLIYSTTASGPFSTCNPCGKAIVLRFGMIDLAVFIMLLLSSGVHIEAQN